MYKAFIVEDELVVREGIREQVNWEEADFVLCGEAPDGEIALSLIEELRPDLVITDIRMPFMDGLELCRIVRQNLPATKIVIISGYGDFDYAKKAIGLQITDYLLKPVGSSDLLEVLHRVKETLRVEEADRKKRLELDEIHRDSIVMMRERFMNDLTTGLLGSANAIEYAKKLGLNLVFRHFCAALLEIVVPADSEKTEHYIDLQNGERIIREMVDSSANHIFFRKALTQFVIVFVGDDRKELEASCSRLCRSLKIDLEKNSALGLFVAIGTVEDRVHMIASSLKKAEAATRFRYIFGDSSIIDYRDAERVSLKTIGPDQSLSKKIGNQLRFESAGNPKTLSGDCLTKLRDICGTPALFTHGFVSIVQEVVQFVEELGGLAAEVLNDMLFLDKISDIRSDTDEQIAYLAHLFEKAIHFREDKRQNKYGDVIRKAKSFINENYSDPEISLTGVAEYVGVSASHFSTIFSQETSQTFISYLMEVRMNNAKKLLKTTSERSSEIGFLVGYKDPHYFSFAFKKHVGATPSDYRQAQ